MQNRSPVSDRGRIGERLQAALAGLQELHLLQEKQGKMVHWALRMDCEEPHSGSVAGPGTEEQRLEATLTVLKQQLSRLRRQDVGLKSHLQQLDQQISELKLDVHKASTEHLESDSRPSSGFFDLSDGGSGSLSNSCTSVYSECLSASQTSLRPHSGPHNHGQEGSTRRRSADETEAHVDPPRGIGVHLGSSRIRTGTGSTERSRPRPVSTGDLDRMLTHGLGFYRPPEVRKPPLCSNLRHVVVDPKFHSDLVSRSGSEVYRYPSPLHAVALQSPIFSLSADGAAPKEVSVLNVGSIPECDQPQDNMRGMESKSVGYIHKILQRSLSKITLQEEPDKAPGVLEPQRQNQTILPTAALQENSKTSAAPNSYPSLAQACLELNEEEKRSLCQNMYHHNSSSSVPREDAVKPREPAPVRDLLKKKESSAPSEFVRAQFVPAGSRHVKVHQADKKTKAVRLRRKSCEKLRTGKQHLITSDRAKESISYSERSPGRALGGRLSWQPSVPSQLPMLPNPRPKSSIPEHMFPDFGKKKQMGSKWQSTSEIRGCPSLVGMAQGQRHVPAPGATYRAGLVRSLSAKPRLIHTTHASSHIRCQRSQYPAHFSAYRRPPPSESEYSADCASLFHSTIAESSEGELSDFTTNRFGDSESSCSSDSAADSVSSISVDEDEEDEEGGLVWAEATLGPTAAGKALPQARTETPACRIKASRALKKKIRRFQPAALKVMTLV